MKKKSDAAKIREYYEAHPDAKPGDVAKALKVKPGSVYVIRQKMKAAVKVTPLTTEFALAPVKNEGETIQYYGAAQAPVEDMVNQPPHYKTGGIETIDFIEAKGLNYRLGNVVKYITRAEHKGDRKEDLQKALWYLQREIERS